MTDFRKLAFVGLIGLGVASLACSSSNGTSGTGGSPGTGTGGSHTGGTTGTGGTGTGTGGTSAGTGGTGTGTGGAAGGTAACTPAPADGLIADFAGDGGIEIVGGLSAYGANAEPTHSVSGGILNVMENNAASSGPQYVGQVLYFNNCIDASAFSGVEFTLGGTFSGCTIQYSTNDAPHDNTVTDPKGTCSLGNSCYSPQAGITSVSAAGAVVMEPWITAAGGDPSLVLDPHQLTSIQWQFTIPAAPDGGAGVCMANLNISQIKFY
jgi:hypothetical protein